VVTDVYIRGGTLNVISYVNEGGQCGLAGHSWVMAMDPCTGGRLSKADFDLNGDGAIDDEDLINIGTVADPIMVPPTGGRFDGKVKNPLYLRAHERSTVEKSYYNTDDTDIKTFLRSAPRLGMTYWRVLRD
jgi:type IV pilus assembly protein PilY1